MIIQKRPFIGPLLPVRCGEKIIKYTETTKLLGILVDNKLCWNKQIQNVCKSYGAKIQQLKRLRYLPTSLLEEIYYKTIIPQVTYCISIWGNCSIPLFSKLERYHLRAARIIYKLPDTVKDYDILTHIKWQDMGYIYKRRIDVEMYKNNLESRIGHLFNIINTRKGKTLEVKRMKTEIGRNSLGIGGPVVWNTLDRELRQSKTIETFKRNLKERTKINKF